MAPKKAVKHTRKKSPAVVEVNINNELETDTTHVLQKDSKNLLQNEQKHLKKRLHQSRRVVFILGTLIGLFVAVFFGASNNDIRNELDRLVSFDSMAGILNDWRGVLPSSVQSMLNDFESLEEEGTLHGSAASFSVGKRMVASLNLTEKHNVVMVPGVISTGIESWGLNDDGDCPSTNHFRKRLWGSFYMLRTMVLDKTCWLKHIMLDPETGLDPPGIRLRAAQGFEAADFFVAGYWIWNKILQNLAVIGYGPNNMLSAAYDWRLAFLDLEKRDHYFSKLQSQIEMTKRLTGQKSILVGHSMGSQVVFYFMKWVEASGPQYGNGGSSWCNDHIEAFVDISGTLLGTPKSIPALISGEMKDTVQLNALAVYGLEKFFSRRERLDMLRSFGGVSSMLPKGGDLIWGNYTSAPDDPSNSLMTENAEGGSGTELPGQHNDTFGTFIRFETDKWKNMTITSSIDYLLETSPKWFTDRVKEHYSWGVAKTKKEVNENAKHHLKWINPLEVALPYAPDMKVYAFYGVGCPTERAYTYREAPKETNLNITIDGENKNAVYFGDGDGTVSLMSHAILHEWQRGSASRFNPANCSVTIVEIKHEPDRFDIRGGAKTADHVDILGSAELNELVLKVAAGKGDTIENRYVSSLRDVVRNLEI